MTMSAEHRSKFAAMVISPYEWKILETKNPTQTNKQTNNQTKTSFTLFFCWINHINEVSSVYIKYKDKS